MQIGKLNQSCRLETIHPLFKELFDFVKSHDFNNYPLGKVEVKGDDLFIMNSDVEGISAQKQQLEMHEKYIDVHILLAGNERIGWKPIEEIEHYTLEYDAERDCALSDDVPRFYVDLNPGEFCVVFPEDAHAPAIGNGKIRKLIGKVKL